MHIHVLAATDGPSPLEGNGATSTSTISRSWLPPMARTAQRRPLEAYSVWGEVGDWRDTIPALSGTTQVRYALDRYGGFIMLHCHFLYHEDHGMMDRIWTGPDTSSCTASGGGGSGETIKYCTDGLPEAVLKAFYSPVIKECNGSFNEGTAEADICKLYGSAPMSLTNIIYSCKVTVTTVRMIQ